MVSLDTQADFLIYDHLRKDAPSGPKVCSYKFIDDSIKAGILQDREKYSCHHATHPKKATKTNYTPEEDLLIQKFVTQKEREGQSIGGNAIYKEFGAKVRSLWPSVFPFNSSSKLNNIVSATYLAVMERSVDQKATSPASTCNFWWRVILSIN